MNSVPAARARNSNTATVLCSKPAVDSPHELGFAVVGSRPIHVVAAAVTASDGRVLVAQRPPGKQLAGGWEFPGGKLEPGETRVAGLARELNEELGIVIRQPRPLMRLTHRYPFGDVLIDMWVVTRYAGSPQGLDGQELRWCTQDELGSVELLPADGPIVRALRLPERLVTKSSADYLIDEFPVDASSMPPIDTGQLHGISCATVADALHAGQYPVDFLVLSRAVSDIDLQHLCETVPMPVFAREVTLEAAWLLGASGICTATCARRGNI